jgi:hypothetical protein
MLLAAQVARCCVTVTAAFVSLRGLSTALTMNMGFNPKHAVMTKFELGQAGYSSVAADQFQRQLVGEGIAPAGSGDSSLRQSNTPHPGCVYLRRLLTADYNQFRHRV